MGKICYLNFFYQALLRPGRLDRKVYVPLPDKTTRFEILRLKLSKMPISHDVDIDKLVDLTENYSGAEVSPNIYIT